MDGVPITRPRTASWSESPDLPNVTHEFRLGLDDITKSNEGIESALLFGALGAGLGYLSRIARSVEGL